LDAVFSMQSVSYEILNMWWNLRRRLVLEWMHHSQIVETVKYGNESPGTRNQAWLCWRGPAAICPTDRPISSWEELHESQSRETVKCGHDSRGARNQEPAVQDQQRFTRPDPITSSQNLLFSDGKTANRYGCVSFLQ
jgi:Zn ribbon nucleic-acid-binding protein